MAREKEWVRPNMVEESLLEVEGAWHPLLADVLLTDIVPNPIKTGGEHGRIKVLTGPNSSGKSVYLKTVGKG